MCTSSIHRERWGGAPLAIVSRSASMKEAVRLAEAVAPRSTTVVILGETGTGKGLLARHVHERSSRCREPLIELNCAGFQRELAESQLFGHEKGAFTGAAERKLGLFEAARGGTLFLDEVGDLDLAVQANLLKAIEDKTLRRLGGLTEIEVDVRLVAATHRDLEGEVAAGRFRRDLYYRLSVFTVRIPSLRERPADIVPLALHFLTEFGAGRLPRLSAGARAQLEAHDWPGNVRELRNVMERASILAAAAEEIALEHLPLLAGTAPTSALLPRLSSGQLTMQEAERLSIEAAMVRHGGNVVAAAAQLGVSRGRLYRKARKYDIPR